MIKNIEWKNDMIGVYKDTFYILHNGEFKNLYTGVITDNYISDRIMPFFIQPRDFIEFEKLKYRFININFFGGDYSNTQIILYSPYYGTKKLPIQQINKIQPLHDKQTKKLF